MSQPKHTARGLNFYWRPSARGEVDPTGLVGTPDSDVEHVAFWPDGTVRVSHVWANFDDEGNVLPAPEGDFPDVSWVGKAPVVTELRGKATCDHKGVLIRDTPFRRVTYFEGPLKQPGVPDYAYRRTWATSFRGHATIYIDHSITWTRAMRDYRVTEVAFAGRVQWSTKDYDEGDAWEYRDWWNGERPLGEPLPLSMLDYYTGHLPAGEFRENKREFWLYGDLHGTSIRDRWAFDPGLFLDSYGPHPRPGRCEDSYIQETKVLGEVSVGARDAVDEYVVKMAKAFHAKATPGRFTESNPPRKWVVKENRPSAHRPGIGSYYCWGETLWLEYARQGNEDLLRLAQGMTGHTVQFGQCSAPWVEGVDKWHQQGAFWKNGEPVGSPPGMSESDPWSAHLGRSPDPMSLYYAWVFGGDYRARAGFYMWWTDAFHQIASWAGANREGNKTIGIVADFIEWMDVSANVRDHLCFHLDRMVKFHMRVPLYNVDPGPLWDPMWPLKAMPHLPPETAADLIAYVLKCRDTMMKAGHTRLKDCEAISLSLVDGRPNVLVEHLGWIAHQVHRAEGVGPISLGDHGLARQWGHLRYALEKLPFPWGLTRTWPKRIPVGNASFGSVGSVRAKGTRINLSTTVPQLNFAIEGIPTGGDPHPCTLVIVDAQGQQVWTGEWRHTKAGPMSWATLGYAISYSPQVPAPGDYTLCIGGHSLEVILHVAPGALKRVVLPRGLYYVRADGRRFELSGAGEVKVTSESKESWVEANGQRLDTYQQNVAGFIGDHRVIDLEAGSDPQARLELTAEMELLL